MRQLALCLVLGLGLAFASGANTATALSCAPPPWKIEQKSDDGAFMLIAIRGLESDNRFYEDTTLRLVRVENPNRAVWEMKSPDIHMRALVANRGDYVVTFQGWCGGGGRVITIRDERGKVVRSFRQNDFVSLWEGLHGAKWKVDGLDPGQRALVVRVETGGATVSRRIRLEDGVVIDRPLDPPQDLPTMTCPPGTVLGRFASAGRFESKVPTLFLVCERGEELELDEEIRAYAFEDDEFRLVFHQTSRRVWTADGSFPGESGPCETLYRDGDEISHHCGPDVEPANLDGR